MKIKSHISWFTTLALLFSISSCGTKELDYDASGTFEAIETIISAEATGVIKQLEVEEGELLLAGQQVGYIDSVQLSLKKQQLEAQVVAILGKKPNIPVQLKALQEELKKAELEQQRFVKLVQGDAATTKQLDDIQAQIAVLKGKIAASRSSLSITSEGLNKDVAPIQAQIHQLEDQLQKCRLINPMQGTVLTKYAEVNEMASIGKPIYKIADLSEITLRIYITGNQLPNIKLNQEVTVYTDDGEGGYLDTKGIVTWISDKAEFTPKTIQTKDERANKVYAVKVKVQNDDTYKIGMYGEVKL